MNKGSIFVGLLRFINNEKHSVFHAVSVKKENKNRIKNEEEIWGQTRVLDTLEWSYSIRKLCKKTSTLRKLLEEHGHKIFSVNGSTGSIVKLY